jgi:hypothetical protein
MIDSVVLLHLQTHHLPSSMTLATLPYLVCRPGTTGRVALDQGQEVMRWAMGSGSFVRMQTSTTT